MLTRTEIQEELRTFIREELLQDPAARLDADSPLLSGGVITSFDLVSLAVFLEERFELTLPESAVSRDHLDTLDMIATLVLASRDQAEAEPEVPATPELPERDLLSRMLPSFRGRPAKTVVGILVGFLILDLSLALALQSRAVEDYLEGAHRERTLYLHQDFRTLMAKHDLGQTPKGPDEIRIIYQGASGAYGNGLVERACPAILERLLRARDPGVKVFNASILGQVMVQHAELLEVTRRHQPDVVVIATGVSAFSKFFVLQPGKLVAYNRPLFHEFIANTPGAAESREVLALDRIVKDAEIRSLYPLTRPLDEHSSIMGNRLTLRRATLQLLSPGGAVTGRQPGLENPKARIYYEKTSRDDPAAMGRPLDFDERALALLGLILERARGLGIKIVFVWEPVPKLRGPAPNRFWSDASLLPAISRIREVVQEGGGAFVDCTDLLDQDAFLDSSFHWTDEGHEVIAEATARVLEPIVRDLREARSRSAGGR